MSNYKEGDVALEDLGYAGIRRWFIEVVKEDTYIVRDNKWYEEYYIKEFDNITTKEKDLTTT